MNASLNGSGVAIASHRKLLLPTYMLQLLHRVARLGEGVLVRGQLVVLGEGCRLDRRLMKKGLSRKLDLVACAAVPLLRKELGA